MQAKRVIVGATSVGVLLAITVITGAASAAGAKTGGTSDRGTLYAAETHTAGGSAFAAGEGHDKALGNVAITVRVDTSEVTTTGGYEASAKRVVLYSSRGTLSGSGSASLTNQGNKLIVRGNLSLTHGSGGLKGHSLSATFTGTGSVSNGQFVWRYTGTYR